MEKKTKETKKTVKVNLLEEWEKKTPVELKSDYQKLSLDICSGTEKNSSLLKKLRKVIARKLTK